MNYRDITTETYNRTAKAMAIHFRDIGPRVEDIERVFDLLDDSTNPRVLEIGCGDGRDAKELIARNADYEGFDISSSMIEIAQSYAPGGHFKVGDAVTYDYSNNNDAVFAFASLLHLDKSEIKQVLDKVHASLKPGGIFYISLKHMPEYSKGIKKDQYGERLFYFYNPRLIKELAGDKYEMIYENIQTLRGIEWFEVALKKS